MRLLLDTHVLLWALVEPARLSARVRELLEAGEHEREVSAASALEIATKTRLGKLAGQPVLDRWDEVLRSLGATELPIGAADGIAAGSMAWAHRDPFDRLLVAQAIARGSRLVTADRTILALPVVVTIPAQGDGRPPRLS